MPFENPFKKLSKPQIYAVIGGGLLIGAYAEYRHHQQTGSWSPFATAAAGSTAAAGENGSAIDPVTGLPYAEDNTVDPETGLTYLAEANEYGSVASAEASVTAYGQSTASGSGIAVNPASPAASGSPNTVVGSSIYTSNAAWSSAVQAGLEDISGGTTYDGTDIGTALGAYLEGQPLTAAQAQVVSVAIAEYGNPPVGTFQIILSPATGASTVTTGSSGSTAAAAAKPPATSPDPVTFSTTANDLNISFPAVGGATEYGYDFSNGHTATTKVTSGTFSIATVGKSGTFKLRAGNAAGWGPYGASKSYSFPDKG
jgi:hypothetical protein